MDFSETSIRPSQLGSAVHVRYCWLVLRTYLPSLTHFAPDHRRVGRQPQLLPWQTTNSEKHRQRCCVETEVRRTRLYRLALLTTHPRILTRPFSKTALYRCVSSTPAVRMRPVVFPGKPHPGTVSNRRTQTPWGRVRKPDTREETRKFCASDVRRRRCTIGQQGRFSTASSQPLTMARIKHDHYTW